MERKLTLQKQTRLHVDGQRGNCMMTCYANYLGVDVEGCPRIEQLFFTEHPESFWVDVRSLWWEQQGYDFRTTASEEEALKEVGDDFYFVVGQSMLTDGVNHLVIFRNGEMVFDPHPAGLGLKEVLSFQYVKKRI